jgi:hypothetical protein
MYRWLGLLLAGACAACGHTQPTGSAFNDWQTPVGYASATHTAKLDSTSGMDINSTWNHNGTYDSHYNDPENAPSSFGSAPPPALKSLQAKASSYYY